MDEGDQWTNSAPPETTQEGPVEGGLELTEEVLGPPAEPAAEVAEPPVSTASPVAEAAPIHYAATIRTWFNDTFANLVASGRVREREAHAALLDLLHRLGL